METYYWIILLNHDFKKIIYYISTIGQTNNQGIIKKNICKPRKLSLSLLGWDSSGNTLPLTLKKISVVANI